MDAFQWLIAPFRGWRWHEITWFMPQMGKGGLAAIGVIGGIEALTGATEEQLTRAMERASGLAVGRSEGSEYGEAFESEDDCITIVVGPPVVLTNLLWRERLRQVRWQTRSHPRLRLELEDF